jgi:hypothetical protein
MQNALISHALIYECARAGVSYLYAYEEFLDYGRSEFGELLRCGVSSVHHVHITSNTHLNIHFLFFQKTLFQDEIFFFQINFLMICLFSFNPQKYLK